MPKSLIVGIVWVKGGVFNSLRVRIDVFRWVFWEALLSSFDSALFQNAPLVKEKRQGLSTLIAFHTNHNLLKVSVLDKKMA